VVFAVIEMNDHSLELNGSVLDPKLNGAEGLAAVHIDSIVVVSSIDVGQA
jgi:hypothetical protein